MVKGTLLCACALLCLGCDNGSTPSTRFGDVDYTISASDSVDIAELASHFTTARIDTMTVGTGYYFWADNPWGFAEFEVQNADSDHVVRSTLDFCNEGWPVCTTGFEDAPGRVDVNGWISAPAYFRADTLWVVHFRDMELEFRRSTTTSKDTIVHYLNMIADSQYEVACATCRVPDVEAINGFQTTMNHDTLMVLVDQYEPCNGVFFEFSDVAGDLTLQRSSHMVCKRLAP